MGGKGELLLLLTALDWTVRHGSYFFGQGRKARRNNFGENPHFFSFSLCVPACKREHNLYSPETPETVPPAILDVQDKVDNF